MTNEPLIRLNAAGSYEFTDIEKMKKEAFEKGRMFADYGHPREPAPFYTAELVAEFYRGYDAGRKPDSIADKVAAGAWGPSRTEPTGQPHGPTDPRVAAAREMVRAAEAKHRS